MLLSQQAPLENKLFFQWNFRHKADTRNRSTWSRGSSRTTGGSKGEASTNNSGNNSLNYNNTKKKIEIVNIKDDLNHKSLEELIYLFNNQDEYVKDYMTPYNDQLNELKDEINKLAGKLLIF